MRSLSGGGGAERVMLNLAAALASGGRRVDLVMGRTAGRLSGEIPSSVNPVDLRGPFAQAVIPTLLRRPGDAAALMPVLLSRRAPRVLGAIPALARYLRRERPDALLSTLNYTNIAALMARDLAQVSTRCVISVQNHPTRQIAASRQLRTRRLAPLMRRFFPRADEITAASKGVATDLSEVAGIPVDRIRTIYNPAATADLAHRQLEDPGHPWFAEGGPPVLLGAGKFKPQKDLSTLIRAFAMVRASRPARLIILGEGPQLNMLRALAAELGVLDDVAFPGFVDNPFAFMARAKLFVLSSAWEGFGMVLVEAMACGCPVVSTDCPSGPSEILEDGRYGALVPVADPEKLGTAIAATLDAPLPAATLRERAAIFSDVSAATHYAEALLGGG